MHTQHQTAAQTVIDAGADYLLTLKDNQPTLTETAQTLMPSAFFPSGPAGKHKARCDWLLQLLRTAPAKVKG